MRILPLALMTVCVLLPARNRPVLRTDVTDRLHAEVVDVEERLSSAVLRRDVDAVQALLASDVRIVDFRGKLIDQAGSIAALKDGRHPAGAAIPQPTMRFYDEVGLVHGRGRMTTGHEVYVLRGWVRLPGGWQLALEHVTDITAHVTSVPPSFDTLDAPIAARRTDEVPPFSADEADVKHALRESHERYWSKDVQGYIQTVGTDLIRAAETGVRSGHELVAFMRDSPHLPRRPSSQLDMWAKVVGNVALAGWLDTGTTAHGVVSRSRFTLALVWRDGRWQIVQIQSTGLTG
jgi:hypothetical protein